jgi:hypothetical protein
MLHLFKTFKKCTKLNIEDLKVHFRNVEKHLTPLHQALWTI